LNFLAGESGSADTVRDPRGFAIKMYTDEGLISFLKKIIFQKKKLDIFPGLWDLVANNTPVFFVRDPFLVCI